MVNGWSDFINTLRQASHPSTQTISDEASVNVGGWTEEPD